MKNEEFRNILRFVALKCWCCDLNRLIVLKTVTKFKAQKHHVLLVFVKLSNQFHVCRGISASIRLDIVQQNSSLTQKANKFAKIYRFSS
jgi:hypothetical protein